MLDAAAAKTCKEQGRRLSNLSAICQHLRLPIRPGVHCGRDAEIVGDLPRSAGDRGWESTFSAKNNTLWKSLWYTKRVVRFDIMETPA